MPILLQVIQYLSECVFKFIYYSVNMKITRYFQ